MGISPVAVLEDDAPHRFVWTLDELMVLLTSRMAEGRLSVMYAEEILDHAAILTVPKDIAELFAKIKVAARKLDKKSPLALLQQDNNSLWLSWRGYCFFPAETVCDLYERMSEMAEKGQIEPFMAIPVLAQAVCERLPWNNDTPSPIARLVEVTPPPPAVSEPALPLGPPPAEDPLDPSERVDLTGVGEEPPPETPAPATAAATAPPPPQTGSGARRLAPAPTPPGQPSSGSNSGIRPNPNASAQTLAAVTTATVQLSRPGTPRDGSQPGTTLGATPAPGQRATVVSLLSTARSAGPPALPPADEESPELPPLPELEPPPLSDPELAAVGTGGGNFFGDMSAP